MSDRDFRIIQLSDCHVSADRGALYRGVNARESLERLFSAVLKWEPDLLLLSGDLSEDGSDESYASLSQLFSATGVPLLTTPGNHDRAELQRNHFPATSVGEALVANAGDWGVVAINSSVANEVPGQLSEPMCASLERVLDGDDRPKLVMLHHQPVPVESAWIDRYPLKKPGRLWAILEGRPEVRGVLWGHIHHAFRATRNGVRLLGAPSTVANSIPFEEQFTCDPAGPACRWIRLFRGGTFATGILRNA